MRKLFFVRFLDLSLLLGVLVVVGLRLLGVVALRVAVLAGLRRAAVLARPRTMVVRPLLVRLTLLFVFRLRLIG